MPLKVDHNTRRLEIADAALDAIAERGLDAVRLVDIAHATAATTGQIVHYFPDKDAVLLAALDAIMEQLLARDGQPESAEELLSALADALPLDTERRRQWNIWLQFASRASHNPSFASRHAHYYRQITRDVACSLSRVVDRRSNAEVLADAIVAVVDGIGVRATLEPKDWPASRQKALLELMLKPMLGLPPSSRKSPRTRK
jgi:AcrR family transcriptional regulator